MSAILLICLFGLVGVVFGLPCLTSDSKKDFDKTRSALKNLESYLTNTVSTLQGQINTINGKVKQLDKDLITMEDDFKKRQWRKYNGHCYFFGTEAADWVTSEKKKRTDGSDENIKTETEMDESEEDCRMETGSLIDSCMPVKSYNTTDGHDDNDIETQIQLKPSKT